MKAPFTISFELDCAVCKAKFNYPAQTACPQCQWPVLLYSTTPPPAQIRELDDLLDSYRQAVEQNSSDIKEWETWRAKKDTLEPAIQQQRQYWQEYDRKLKELTLRQTSLRSDPILGFDRTAAEQTIRILQQKIAVKQREIDTRAKPTRLPALTVRCSYHQQENEIKMVAADLWRGEPVNIDPLLGLAIAAQPFSHYAEAEMIIPVKDQRSRIKVIGVGDEFSFPLAMRPLSQQFHHRIVHLYAHTVAQFIIE